MVHDPTRLLARAILRAVHADIMAGASVGPESLADAVHAQVMLVYHDELHRLARAQLRGEGPTVAKIAHLRTDEPPVGER